MVSLDAPRMSISQLALWVEEAVSITSNPAYTSLAAALEQAQRSAGFAPVLTAADLRILRLYIQQDAVRDLEGDEPEARQILAAAMAANAQLAKLDPSAAALLHTSVATCWRSWTFPDALMSRPPIVRR